MGDKRFSGDLDPGLLTLPVEVLYIIHLWALNPALPLTSRYLYHVFKQAPPSISALYLFLRYADTSKDLVGIVSAVLKYPLCTIDIFKRLLSILPDEYRHLYPNPRQTITASPVLDIPNPRRTTAEPLVPKTSNPRQTIAAPPVPEKPTPGQTITASPVLEQPKQLQIITEVPEIETPTRLFKLPKRLFRNLGPPDTVGGQNEDTYVFLKYLYSLPPITYPNTDKTQLMLPDSNSFNGYPLAKAVKARDTRLIKLLLAHKANPNRKDKLAVLLAIQNRDLELVKLLVEGDQQSQKGRKRQSKHRNNQYNPSHEEEVKDLVVVDNIMLRVAVVEGGRDIVEWLVKEKGCVPDIKTLRFMG